MAPTANARALFLSPILSVRRVRARLRTCSGGGGKWWWSSVGRSGRLVGRGRVEERGCVRGRPGLLRHSTWVGYRAGDMMCDGVFRQMGCARSLFLAVPVGAGRQQSRWQLAAVHRVIGARRVTTG